MNIRGAFQLWIAAAFFLAYGQPALPPLFTYSPENVPPGGTVTVKGGRFAAGTPAVSVALVNAQGVRTTLAVSPLANGAFLSTFTVPPSFPAGRYFVSVVDSNTKAAINLVGALVVTPPSSPWFSFSPTAAPPGGSIQVSAQGYSTASTSALVGMVDATGTVRTLGTAPLVNGAFQKTFRIPLTAPLDTAQQLFVRDSTSSREVNISGHLTVAQSAVPLTIPVGGYPVGAAVDASANRVYVPNTADNTVSVIDGAADQVIATIPVGAMPCAIGINPAAQRVYVANVNTNDLSVINTATNQVIATVPVGMFPCAVGVTPGNNRIFVGNYASNDVTIVDGNTLGTIGSVPVSGPFGLATNPVTSKVYVVSGYTASVVVINGLTGLVEATVPVGKSPDAVGVNSSTNKVYVANYLGDSVTVLDGASNSVLATVPVGSEPSAVAANPVTNRIYITNYASNSVSVLDGNTNAVLSTLPVGLIPDGAAVNSLSNKVYIVNSISRTVSVIK